MGQNRFTPIRYDLVSPTNLEYRREYAVYVFFLSRSSLSQSSRLSIILSITLYNTRSPGKQNFTRYHRSKFQTRLSKIIGVFRINIFSRELDYFESSLTSLEFRFDRKEFRIRSRIVKKRCENFNTPKEIHFSSPISILASRRLIKYYLSSVTRRPSNRIKLISPPWDNDSSLPPKRKGRYLLSCSCPSPPVNSCFLLVRRCSMSPRRLYLSTAVDSKSNFLDRRGRTGVRQGKAKREEEIRERRWYAVTQRA